MEGSNSSKSSHDHAKISKYFLCNRIRSTILSIDNEVPNWSSQGWSPVSKSIVLKSSSIGSTPWPKLPKGVYEFEFSDWGLLFVSKTCEVDGCYDKLKEESYA